MNTILSSLRHARLSRLPAWLALGLLAACAAPPAPDTAPQTSPASEPAVTPVQPGQPGEASKPQAPSWPQPVARPASKPVAPSNKFYVKTSWQHLPGWQQEDFSGLWKGLLANCRSVLLRTGSTPPQHAPAVVDSYAWQRSCAAARQLGATPDAAAIRQFLETWLEPWNVRQGTQEARSIATGYYEPVVHASRQPEGLYQWPLLEVPKDLLTIDLGRLYPELVGKRVRGKVVGNRVVPYDTRGELDQPERRPPSIVYVNDPVEAFFLQIQGSGRAVINTGAEQGKVIRLAYADHNGHPYVSIGKWLVDQGEMPLSQASMQGIKAWAQQNPNRVKTLLNVNPGMVFFREEPIPDPEVGPNGAFGLPLTPRRSIAVDPSIVPLGSLAYLSTTFPGSQQPFNRVMLAQDTGGAIKGAARVDVFWGFGDEAGDIAGKMKNPSRLWVLWPKGEGAPTDSR
ncbi:MAG: MltA domain-containing protein [Pigmentiphaga sp.]